MRTAEWVETPHPAVTAPCRAFRCDTLRGLLGVVPLAQLFGAVVRLEDPKGTGELCAVVDEWSVPELARDQPSWLIVGPHEGRDVLYTLHPGEPIPPSTMRDRPDERGELLFASEAYSRGITHAKVGEVASVKDLSGTEYTVTGTVRGCPAVLRLLADGGRWRAVVENNGCERARSRSSSSSTEGALRLALSLARSLV